MRKISIGFFIILFTSLFISCNAIVADEPVLTDENSSSYAIPYKYWYPLSSKNLQREDVFVVEDTDSLIQKKQWELNPFVKNSEKKKTMYLRRKKSKRKHYIFQVAFSEKNKQIGLFLGKKKNDSTIQLYAYNDLAMEFAANGDLKQLFKDHVTIKRDEVSFDSIAAIDLKPDILDFVTALDNSKYFHRWHKRFRKN